MQKGKDGKPKVQKKITSVDDLEKEKKALFAEVGLDESGRPKNDKETIDKIADKLKIV